MRVVHVYKDSYPPVFGGVEQHIHTLVHQLKQHVSPTVLVSGSKRSKQIDNGVTIDRVGQWGRLQGAPISPTLPNRLRRIRADLLHFHMPNPTGELAYLLSGCRVPAVATYHSDIVRQAAALRVYRPFLNLFLRRVRHLIVATPYHISSSPILPDYRDKCRIIPFGLSLARFRLTPMIERRAAAIREQFGPRLILFVGKFRYYKGLDYLLRAMARVEGRLLLVGEGGEEERLRALATELRLGDRVVWMPHLEHEELLSMLHACDVFALPSVHRSEAFGIVQLEAHACGKPVVCTALGTGVEYVNLHGRTGLVVPPRDADALARALDRLLSDPDYRLQLGQAARARVEAEFTQEQMAASTLALYQEVLALEGKRSEGPGLSTLPSEVPMGQRRSV